MHVFTSVTSNYIPKARVLAKSVKKHHPEAVFFLILSDAKPDWLGSDEPFDHVVTADELPIPNFRSWVFKHSLVEMCTAVKGPAFQYIRDTHNADKIIYFDPDIAVFSRQDDLLELLDTHGVVLTPHQAVPETDARAVVDNEICSLKHGVFNLGFLALNTAITDGNAFLDWWSARLYRHCYDDIPGGLFTDQRWIDLAPCFFDGIHVLRRPNFNVATWNLTHRTVTGSMKDGIYVNDQPLRFYHFSGFDSGDFAVMLGVYGNKNKTLNEMKDWYIRSIKEMGQEEYGKNECIYARFDNGEPVTNAHRRLYRSREDLQKAFPDPFSTQNVDASFYDWYRVNVAGNEQEQDVYSDDVPADVLRLELYKAKSELDWIKNSRSWKVANKLRKLYRAFKYREF